MLAMARAVDRFAKDSGKSFVVIVVAVCSNHRVVGGWRSGGNSPVTVSEDTLQSLFLLVLPFSSMLDIAVEWGTAFGAPES